MRLTVVDMIWAGLTERERAIAELILEARSNFHIARALGISEQLVKQSLSRLCRRARIPGDRVALVLLLLGLPCAQKRRLRVRRKRLRDVPIARDGDPEIPLDRNAPPIPHPPDRCVEKGCPYPQLSGGRCRSHLADLTAESSVFGSSFGTQYARRESHLPPSLL